jgi:hypothetical protein
MTEVLALGAHGAVVATAAAAAGVAEGTAAWTCAAAGIRAVWVGAVPDLRALAALGLGPTAPTALAAEAADVAAAADANATEAKGAAGAEKLAALAINVTGAGDTMVGAALWHPSRRRAAAAAAAAEAGNQRTPRTRQRWAQWLLAPRPRLLRCWKLQPPCPAPCRGRAPRIAWRTSLLACLACPCPSTA